MPRLVVLTQYFPPEMGAPQARLSELGERLLERGWEVEVLTALPNYPTGRVFAGYRRFRPCREMVGRLPTVRVPLWPAKGGAAKRLACYLSFVLAACWFGPSRCRRPDLLVAESPPLFIGIAARYLAWRWRCPLVLNLSDLWPGSFLTTGILRRGTAFRLLEALELWTYRAAAGITGQSEEIAAEVRRKAPGTPVAVVTNGVDPVRFGPEQADEAARALLGSEPGPVFLFGGLMGVAQGLDQIVDLARDLPRATPGRIVLVGDGTERERLLERVEREGIDRVQILPAQPRDRMPALLAAADAAVISLGMSIPGSVPSKIYEAMASARPILMVAEGEAARRVEEAGAGIAVNTGDPRALEAAFTRLATDPELRGKLGAGGREAAETTYNRDRIADRLDAFLREVAG